MNPYLKSKTMSKLHTSTHEDDTGNIINAEDVPSTSKTRVGTTSGPLPDAKRAKISPDQQSSSRTSTNEEALQDCLQQYFGFSSFKSGQLEAIQAIINGQDVAIFWATGQGKSLVYQIPALSQPGKVTVVVSPLISLMQDQVQRLNGLSSQHIATYLGSGQTNLREEQYAIEGKYKLVYVTPEKLSSMGFLDRLSQLNICCIAIDEAHCVSQWGYDFRPQYRQAGISLRQHSTLKHVPIVALTATAVPRVQQDIIQNLQLRHPIHISKLSFDRPNLILKIKLKEKEYPLASAMEPLISSLIDEYKKKSYTASSSSSTIIYAVTRDMTEEITSYLQQRLQSEGYSDEIDVQAYHAGLSPSKRQQVHTQFLIGQTQVVVATIAFGLGIDKPDTRRIIHYGPPKSIEEYYQQIGRAGRDGLIAECIMYTTINEFDRYLSDFYIGNLQGDTKQMAMKSTQALKSFALNKETCRRKALLDFFEETPKFGNRCGTCDNCQNYKTYGDDTVRDFTNEAQLILLAISALKEPSMSNIIDIISGKIIETYRYASGQNPQQIQNNVNEKRKSMARNRTSTQFLKELVAAMSQKDYVKEATKSATVGGGNYNRSWTVYSLGPEGLNAYHLSELIKLPVPETLRESERKEEARRNRLLENLKERGVDINTLPAEELQKGDGEVIRAYSKWNNYLAAQEKKEDTDKCAHLKELLSSIQEWRSRIAVQNIMAPASVLPEHVMFTVAYVVATLPPGLTVDSSDLLTAGVRSRELDSLVEKVNTWISRYGVMASTEISTSEHKDSPMQFPAGPIQGKKWPFAIYKPQKKTGKTSWESSYERFQNGESPQAIAMASENGRPIQAMTVVGHIQDGFLQGRPVDLQRLALISKPPNKSEWEQLEQAEVASGMNTAGDPSCSGIDGDKFTMTDFLRPILGDELMDTPREERTEQNKERLGEWYNHLKWYLLLKRTGVKPSFES